VSETSGRISKMTQTIQKRGRDQEALSDSIDIQEPKHLHIEKTEQFLHLLQFDKTLADEEEEYAPSEELVNGVVRGLEEELGVTSYSSSNFGDNSAGTNISNGHSWKTLAPDSTIDLCYLLEASDDELGIPVLNWKDEVCQSPKLETSEGFWSSSDLKSLGETWHLEDDFYIDQQFLVYEGSWDASQDYINGDFANQGLLFDVDFSASWKLETADGM